MNDAQTSSNSPEKPPRLLALDAFRGLTILGMILVNNPGSWAPGQRYWPLDHAAWHGWTPTDLVFPFFLFIVGTALAFSLKKYRQGETVSPAVYGRIFRRTAVLILLGLGMGVFGKVCDMAFGDATSLHLELLRWPGVLQRIALAYLAASLIVLHVPLRGQAILAVVLLAGYAMMLRWHPSHDDYASNLSPEGNVVREVDLALLGANHMYTQAKTEKTDPEGLLSTLPAIAGALLGYWAGLAIDRRGARWKTVWLLVVCGAVVAAAGWAWDAYLEFPINKKLWTSSFVLLTSGLAMIGLAGCLAKFDVLGWRRLARPFEIVGVNAIFAFVGSGLLARLLDSIQIGGQSIKTWIYKLVFAGNLADPRLASLGYALMTVAFWWLVLWAMSRRGWSLRV